MEDMNIWCNEASIVSSVDGRNEQRVYVCFKDLEIKMYQVMHWGVDRWDAPLVGRWVVPIGKVARFGCKYVPSMCSLCLSFNSPSRPIISVFYYCFHSKWEHWTLEVKKNMPKFTQLVSRLTGRGGGGKGAYFIGREHSIAVTQLHLGGG